MNIRKDEINEKKNISGDNIGIFDYDAGYRLRAYT
jgi:hypothetical protein